MRTVTFPSAISYTGTCFSREASVVPGTELYPGPVRSVYHGDPDYLLIEADYTGAELSAVAYASGDPVLIEHIRRNALPSNDPQYRDSNRITTNTGAKNSLMRKSPNF